MLEHLGEVDAASRLMKAIEDVCAAGIVTPDAGGKATTREVTDAVIEAIRGSNTLINRQYDGSKAMKIGVIGLGSMGYGIATSLLRSGHEVYGADVQC